MANQIVVSAGAKVRNLSGVLTATSGVVSFLPIDVSLGIPQLDVNGKILVSQLPNSVMEYKGTWNAATNTPTLANGTGNQGDVYLCNVAGTVDFGAGPIAFFVGDQVIYSGSIWQRASGSTGTVTSVAVTESGDSLNITGSPITTSGTINIGFNGTNLQYVNGAGNLTTFPDLTGFVPYTGATANVNIGTYSFIANNGTYNSEMSPSLFGVENAAGTIFGLLEYNKLTLTNSTGAGSIMEVNAQGLIFPDASVQISSYTDAKARLALSLTTTGTSGVATYNNTTGVFNIPNYGSALSGYVPYTGATQDVDLGAFKLNAQSLHIKGTAGNGHLGLKHQSASATASANEVSLFADSLGDLSWLNGNLYLSKFITSGNTAARSYTFPNANGTVALTSDLGDYVTIATTQTITGAKTFSGGVTFSSSVTTNNLTFANSGFFLTLQPPTLSVNRTVTLPNGTGTLALTSDISYPVTSVFGRTGAVVATSGDYTTAQVTESGNLYFTDSRARLALSFVAGSGAYNSTTGVITIPTNNNQITNGAGYTTNVGTVTSVAATGGTGISISGSPITTSGTITITNTAPDQTVAITASTGISVTGTYPNFTITNTSPSSGGTVTSVAALTLGTSGTDLSSTVATSTTTPVITLNVPTASATNRGALSSADFTTFNNKQGTITLTTTGTSGAATFTSNTLNIPNYGSALSGYLPLTGGTLTGALGGTSATFSGAINLTGTANSFQVASIFRNANRVFFGGDTGGFFFNNSGNTSTLLQITDAGAATFSSSVTVTGGINGYSGLNGYAGVTHNFFVDWSAESQITTLTNTNLFFGTNAQRRMTIMGGGNVLIGTTTDAGQKLQVNGSILTGGSIKIPSTSYFIGNATYGYRFNNGADSLNLLILTDSGNATFYGSVIATGFFESSDSRLKTLIQDNYQTKGIASITPKLYTKNGKVELGYYAQDLVGILDSAVSKGSDDMLSLSYREVLVAKVYALEQRIKELETK